MSFSSVFYQHVNKSLPEITQLAITEVQETLELFSTYKDKTFGPDGTAYTYYSLLLQLLELPVCDEDGTYLSGHVFDEELMELLSDEYLYISYRSYDRWFDLPSKKCEEKIKKYNQQGYDGDLYQRIEDPCRIRIRTCPSIVFYSFTDFILWLCLPTTWIVYKPVVYFHHLLDMYRFWNENRNGIMMFA